MDRALTSHITTFTYIQSKIKNMGKTERCGERVSTLGEVLRFLLSEEHKDFLLAQRYFALWLPSPLEMCTFASFFFSHKFSESTKEKDTLHHKYLTTLWLLQ